MSKSDITFRLGEEGMDENIKSKKFIGYNPSPFDLTRTALLSYKPISSVDCTKDIERVLNRIQIKNSENGYKK